MPTPSFTRSRHRRVTGVLALLVALATALLAPAGTAYAALPTVATASAHTAHRAAARHAQPAQHPRSARRVPVKDHRSAARPAHSTAGLAGARTRAAKGVNRPVAPPAPRNGVKPSLAVLHAARAKAATAALAHAARHAGTVRPADTGACGGPLTADTVTPCANAASGTDTWTVTVPDGPDTLLVEATQSGGDALAVGVTAADGTAVACSWSLSWAGPLQCPVSASGTYTLAVSDSGSAYTLAYSALLSDSTCTAVGTSFAAPDTDLTLAAGSTGACGTLDASPGDILRPAVSTDEANVAVYDATGARVCLGAVDCTLTGTAPYRTLVGDFYGNADAVTLRVNRISDPQGCLTAAQLTYGTAPDATSDDRCRSLTVTTADHYRIAAADPSNGGASGTLYTPDGTVACTGYSATCALTTGTYFYVLNENPSVSDTFGLVFLAADETRGCTATGDTGFAAGPVTGTSAGAGEQICLTLPTAAGKAVYLFNEPPADDALPNTAVVDATGAQTCPVEQYVYHVCTLTGTTPFHVVLSALNAGAPYRTTVQRTDATDGCAAWPQSGFGGSYGATVTLTDGAMARCLTIPANAHSAEEMIDYTNAANQIDGAIYVNDPTGQEICVGNSSAVCSYTAGTAYTALVIGTGGPDTYHVVRRDISATATCAAPASTKVGGASTPEDLTSALDSACVRVSGATTDKWWISGRAPAPTPAGVEVLVTNAAGQPVCWQTGVSCELTGSTGYQIIAVAHGYSGITIPAHLDTWRVATASGWAPECAANTLSGDGFSHSATLTETTTAYCAVVPMRPSERIGVYGTGSGVFTGQPWVSMYSDDAWTGTDLCYGVNYGTFAYSCRTSASTAELDLLIVSPSQAPTPVSFSVQGLCASGCATPPAAPQLTSVTPATGPADSGTTVTLHGSGLNVGDTIQLRDGNDSQSGNGFVTSAAADGTSLTAQFYPGGPGTYDVEVMSASSAEATLPAAFTATAAIPTVYGAFVPVTPTRILNTATGVGAAKAHVAANGTVKLQLTGKGGVPATGVTAVALNTTATGGTATGRITAYPVGAAAPGGPTVSYTAARTVAGLLTVRPGTGGAVDLRNASTGTVDLTADVTGYWTSTGTGGAYTPTGPAALLDTRSGLGAPKAQVAAGGTVKLQVAGQGGVPAAGATAVALTVAGVGGTQPGTVTAWADGKTAPAIAGLDFAAGQTISNLMIVPVANGKVDLRNGSTAPADLTADVAGYFSAGAGTYHSVNPVTVLDTHDGTGGAGGTIIAHSADSLDIMDSGQVPIPGEVTDVVLDVTTTAATAPGSLTVYADGGTLPATAHLHFGTGQSVTDQVIVPVVNGKIDFYNRTAGTVDVVATLEGYDAAQS